MNIIHNNGVVFLFLLFIVLTGVWLNRSDFPYGTLVLTVHKLLSLAVLIFYIRHVYLINKIHSLTGILLVAIAATIVFLVAAIITGGLASTEKWSTRLVLLLHRLFPILAILGIAVSRLMLKN